MSTRNQNWYDLQSARQYPLHDSATGVDDSGKQLPNNIILDCNIKYPDVYGKYAFLQAVTVSPGLVSVLIGAADDAGAATTIAAVSVTKPMQLNKNYSVQALVPGVGGWMVFGEGVEVDFAGRYENVIQTRLSPTNAHAYASLPIQSIKKSGVQNKLTGAVNLNVAAPISAELKTIQIGGQYRPALVFSLTASTTDITYNPLSYFTGTCAERPESGTCPQPPIETINGITPDCAGNIQIDIAEGSELILYHFTDCGGLGLDVNLDLDDVCGQRKYEPPREPTDNCETP
jgi:hypothetical protein